MSQEEYEALMHSGDGAGHVSPTNPQPSSLSTFLIKLLAMVEDSSCQNLISWSPSGRSFVVYDAVTLAKNVLPKYFKHNNFSSFVRQLNMYDFHKIQNGPATGTDQLPPNYWEFVNENFIRGQPQLMVNMRRKAQSTATKHTGTPAQHNRSDSLKRVLNKIEQISERHKVINSKMEVMESDSKIMWNEMTRLKDKHETQQQTINKVLYFLTSVYAPERIEGNNKRRRLDDTIQGPAQMQAIGGGGERDSLMYTTMQDTSLQTQPAITLGQNGLGIGNGWAVSITPHDTQAQLRVVSPRMRTPASPLIQPNTGVAVSAGAGGAGGFGFLMGQ